MTSRVFLYLILFLGLLFLLLFLRRWDPLFKKVFVRTTSDSLALFFTFILIVLLLYSSLWKKRIFFSLVFCRVSFHLWSMWNMLQQRVLFLFSFFLNGFIFIPPSQPTNNILKKNPFTLLTRYTSCLVYKLLIEIESLSLRHRLKKNWNLNFFVFLETIPNSRNIWVCVTYHFGGGEDHGNL